MAIDEEQALRDDSVDRGQNQVRLLIEHIAGDGTVAPDPDPGDPIGT